MTFSLVLAVPAADLLGAATASRSLAVGNAVPAVRPGVGAVVSQAWTNRSLRGRLLDLVVQGEPPEDAVATLPGLDEHQAWRQVGLVDATGRSGVHTGTDCTYWAGSAALDGPVAGIACANYVGGPGVVAAMVEAVSIAPVPLDPDALAAVLLAALGAGQAAGGDLRGQQSAAVQAARGRRQSWSPPDLDVDLRVDDHDEPLTELDRLLGVLTARTGPPPPAPR